MHGGLSGKGSHGGSSAPNSGGHGVALVSSGGGPGPGSNLVDSPGNGSGPSQETFTYFPLYVLDNDNGVVLFPGVLQQATLRRATST